MKLSGKIAVVTGGAMGNGFGIVKTFVKYGAKVVVLDYDEKISENLKAFGENVLAYKVDIRNAQNVKKVMDDVKNKFGKIDVLVNNAGIAIDTTFEDKTGDNFIKILKVNLIGPFLVSKEVGNFMNDDSSIININYII